MATDETAEEVLIAHQRHRGGCLCGWSDLGKSHPGHQVAMLRQAAKARLHPMLHELDVRINNLPGDCHCNLIAEVVLDALYGRADQIEEGADRD